MKKLRLVDTATRRTSENGRVVTTRTKQRASLENLADGIERLGDAHRKEIRGIVILEEDPEMQELRIQRLALSIYLVGKIHLFWERNSEAIEMPLLHAMNGVQELLFEHEDWYIISIETVLDRYTRAATILKGIAAQIVGEQPVLIDGTEVMETQLDLARRIVRMERIRMDVEAHIEIVTEFSGDAKEKFMSMIYDCIRKYVNDINDQTDLYELLNQKTQEAST